MHNILSTPCPKRLYQYAYIGSSYMIQVTKDNPEKYADSTVGLDDIINDYEILKSFLYGDKENRA